MTATLCVFFIFSKGEPTCYFSRLTCCLSAAVLMFGKTFTVTEQEDAESSTTTDKLLNTIELERN